MLRMFGTYELIQPLGRGAMGEVYLARDPRLGREVAIKTIRPEVLLAPDARERFHREARAAGTLNHPHLVTVHEFGEAEGGLFLAMEYVEGRDLSGLLREGALTPREILEVMAQVCEGLAHAHAKGILHRDIKPSNIRVTRISGRPFAKVMDFGIAHLAGSDMTSTGTLLGTFGYMAPEYVQSGVPTTQTDLFAVGVMLHEAFAGERPFQGDTTATILFRVVNDHPRSIDAGRFQGVSPRTQTLLRRALAKDPQHRFPDATALAQALRAAQDPAWEGLEGPAGNLPTAAAALGDLETVGLAPAREPGTPKPLTLIRTVPEEEGRSLPWGWAVAVGLLLIAAWMWPRPRREAAQPVPTHPEVATAPPGRTGTPELPKPLDAPIATPREPEPHPAAVTAPVELRPEPARDAPRDLPPALDLDTAERNVAREPEAALRTAHQLLGADPGNRRALALKLTALYRLERYGAMALTFREAHQAGLQLPDLAQEPLFRQMVDEETRSRRIPQALRQRLPPPLGEGQGPLREPR